jgi:outer membrane receptor protein involved in Fe transport
MAGYSRNIFRPSYYQLRNRVDYDNPYCYESGNPFLKPTINDNFTALIKWKGFLFSVNYDRFKNMIFLIPQKYEGDILMHKTENLNRCSNLLLSAFYSATVGIWQPSAEIDFNKGFLEYDNQHFNQPLVTVKIKNNFSFPQGFRAGMDNEYGSRGNSDLYCYYSRFRTDIYLSKTFFAEKLRVNISGNDIFNTDKYRSKSNINGIYSDGWSDLFCHPRLSISLTYNFNAAQSKYKGEQASEELNRM